jgi:hypothetical protein
VNKKIVLPLALSLAALAVTISPTVGARTSRVPDEQGRHQAEAGARRRPVKRRKSVQAQESTYTCPMHSDVHSKSPGECPKCKMELELEQPNKAKSE